MTGHAHKKVFGFINGDVEMQCDAHGLPRPEFLWYRNAKRISLKNVKSIDNHSTLRVSKSLKV